MTRIRNERVFLRPENRIGRPKRLSLSHTYNLAKAIKRDNYEQALTQTTVFCTVSSSFEKVLLIVLKLVARDKSK